MMPQITWHDGSQKYLHVDVHQIEDYQVYHDIIIAYSDSIVWQVEVEDHIAVLQQRLNWLTSGSRAPFGVVSENR